MSPQTTQLLGAAATLYGLGGALSVLLQARRMHVRGTSGDVSVRFFAVYVGGFAVWLLYGLGIGDLPVIVVHAVGLLCGTVTLAVALRLRGPAAVGTPARSDAGLVGRERGPANLLRANRNAGAGRWASAPVRSSGRKLRSRARPDFPEAPTPEKTYGEQALRPSAKGALRPMTPTTPRSLLGTRNAAIAKEGAS